MSAPTGSDHERVADSLVATLLAGALVGLCLAGLDIAGIGQTFRPIWELLAIDRRAASVLPFMVLCGMIGGFRAAGTTLLIGHYALKALKQTSGLAYLVGGAFAATGYALLMHGWTGETPTHGFLIDGLAGGACGLLYRRLAGTRPSPEP